jgi:hypothetical protein
VTNIGSDDECFEDSGCEVNDSQISYDESALSDIVDQQENCCGIDLSMKTMRRNSTEGKSSEATGICVVSDTLRRCRLAGFP